MSEEDRLLPMTFEDYLTGWGDHRSRCPDPAVTRTRDEALSHLIKCVGTMWSGRYEINIDDVEVPDELEEKFPCPVAVNLGPLAEAWCAVLDIEREEAPGPAAGRPCGASHPPDWYCFACAHGYVWNADLSSLTPPAPKKKPEPTTEYDDQGSMPG